TTHTLSTTIHHWRSLSALSRPAFPLANTTRITTTGKKKRRIIILACARITSWPPRTQLINPLQVPSIPFQFSTQPPKPVPRYIHPHTTIECPGSSHRSTHKHRLGRHCCI